MKENLNINFAPFNVVTFNPFNLKDSEGIIAKGLTQISTDNVKDTLTPNLVRKRSSKMLSKFQLKKPTFTENDVDEIGKSCHGSCTGKRNFPLSLIASKISSH